MEIGTTKGIYLTSNLGKRELRGYWNFVYAFMKATEISSYRANAKDLRLSTVGVRKELKIKSFVVAGHYQKDEPPDRIWSLLVVQNPPS